MRREYSITDETSDGALIDTSQWNTSIRPGMQIGLNIVLKALSSWENTHHCPKCRDPIFENTLSWKKKTLVGLAYM
jgi:hypothetical protein